MRENRHNPGDLKQYQSLSLESKIILTQQRIKAWYESWTRFEIYDKETGKTRFVTHDTRDYSEPPTKETEWIERAWPGAVYVSFSGGIDSTVLKHLVDSMYDDVPSVFANTGLEYPEIQRFVREIKAGKYDCFNPDVVIVRPEMRFDEVVKEYGYPIVSKTISKKVGTVLRNGKGCQTYKFFEGTAKTKQGNPSLFNCQKWDFLCDAPFKVDYFCCEIMKKKPFKAYEAAEGRKPFTGVMAYESKTREAVWTRNGCNAFDSSNPASNPLSFWTKQDVLEYIKKFNVPYCPVYGEVKTDLEGKLETTGCDRTGCIFCGFGCHLEKEPNRFQRLKETHPRQYNYCINGGEMVDGKWQPNKEGLGLGRVLDYIDVKY